MDMTGHDLAATIDTCAYELRQVGDGFYWRYKLLEILLKNYHNVTKIKEESSLHARSKGGVATAAPAGA
ncbi:hypothetical protein JOQ06_030322 [Pogonophryne albipinna]|uniref:Uncharacterized protein n=1 Tax=Pogonophryne albipinna TaxID=1090488 RepID=A0AAD6FFR8_9TELE|nr:hypothetical protein JOQ06_030322 [Pogonophryne albipinna]